MPIERTALVLPAGTHNLGNRTGAPADLANLRDGPYSLHHVLPYRYPLFVGFLVETFRNAYVKQADQATWPTNATDRIAVKAAPLLKVVSRFGGQQQDLPSRFAWMGPNLFQGPSGNFRVDDPGSNPEPVKPISMEPKVWDALTALRTKIERLTSSLSSNNGYQAVTQATITVGDLEDLLTLMDPLAKRGHGNALSFTASDWLCLTSRSPQLQLRFNAVVTDDFKNRFRRQNAQDVVAYQPLLSFGPTIPVVWRLRQATEALPQDVFQSPQLQPG